MSYADANRRYFDAISDSYDSKPWFAKANNQVADALRADLSWIGIPLLNNNNNNNGDPGTDATTTTVNTEQVRLLDYACGTGLMTRVFGPYVSRIIGIDISPNMVSTFNSRAAAAGLPSDVASAVVGDVFDKANPQPPSLSDAKFWNFDMATVGFGFHHFEDVVFAARQLKQRLRPGGVLLITDFLQGGDLLADEHGEAILGSDGDHAQHDHHDHHEHNSHTHQDHPSSQEKHDISSSDPAFRSKMNASIVVPHFTIDGVKQFFTEAGFVDVAVVTMKERCYMEFAGKKIWRTILFARGRRPLPLGEERKSEL